MTWSDVHESGARTWTFMVDSGHGMDAPQAAKKKVADEYDVDYDDLAARLINREGLGDTYVAVIEVRP